MSDIIQSLIPSATSIILFYLAVVKDSLSSKRKTSKERLENYYVPFYQLYCRGLLNELKLSQFDMKARGQFLDLFSSKLHYMDTSSQRLYAKFYHAFLNLLDAEDDPADTETLLNAQKELDNIFTEISTMTLAEYKRLIRYLKLPRPSI